MWPVSFVDGVFQVADADGVHYPLTMQHIGLAAFNPGWTPRGLQTGLPPFHVLELVHEEGLETFWFMDELLEYRGNAVVHLNPDDRGRYFEAVEPMAREIFEQAVRNRHPAVPAAAHHFEGFLSSSVRDLLTDAVARAIPRPDVVRPGALREVGGYGRDGVTLPASRVEELLRTEVPAAGPDVIELDAHRALRGFDEASGAVFYVLQGADAADRHLYVPAVGAVFGEGDAHHDPVLPLVLYYATHLDRAVPLPEIAEIGFDLIEPHAPPQHGLDEPPVAPSPAQATDPVPARESGVAPGAEPVTEPGAAGGEAAGEAASGPGVVVEDRASVRGTDDRAGDHDPGAAPAPGFRPDEHPVAAPGHVAADAAETPVYGHHTDPEPVAAAPERRTDPVPATEAAEPDAGAGPRNWWQRLLGLGNP